ncbi:MAG: hypothetical protein GEU86_11525 [Actinophytocola sp.]|nr:hypothetical protein [Actinophytocola sp.]
MAGFTLATGFWALFAPRSFAVMANFPPHEHFLHDIGVFQIGIGVTVLLAVIWPDALHTVLAGFFVANTVHTVNHFVDAQLGGYTWQAWALAALSVLVAGAFWLRLGQLGTIFGGVQPATVNELQPFVRQKTISLTTFGKNGNAGSTPVSIAVDGDRGGVHAGYQLLQAW